MSITLTFIRMNACVFVFVCVLLLLLSVSTLGAYLAVQHFSPLAAAPCAVSAVFHSGLGSLLAYIWGRSPIDEGTVHATTGGGNDNVEDVQKEDSLPPSFLNRTEEIDQERGE